MRYGVIPREREAGGLGKARRGGERGRERIGYAAVPRSLSVTTGARGLADNDGARLRP